MVVHAAAGGVGSLAIQLAKAWGAGRVIAVEAANGGATVDVILEMIAGPMSELLTMVEKGALRPVLGGSYPLAEARRTHEDLRARRSIGKLMLEMGR